MCKANPNHSFLVRMRVCNLGCIGPDGIEVELDQIVCLVGSNNSGKSTVLRAYEAAATSLALFPDDFCAAAQGQPTTVELWVHIPTGMGNVDERWKADTEGLKLVRSKWTWPREGGKPTRETWDPVAQEYTADGKAAGLDNVFNARLPKPLRVGSLDSPAAEHKELLKLILEPIDAHISSLMNDDQSSLRSSIESVKSEIEKPVAQFQKDLESIQAKITSSYGRIFSDTAVNINISVGDLDIDPKTHLAKFSDIGILEPHGRTRWDQQGTGSQKALFWSMLEVRSELSRLAAERKLLEKTAAQLEKQLEKEKSNLETYKTDSAKENCKERIKTIEESIEALRPAGKQPEEDSTALLPGYMLLIDEPETALHPAAIRSAKEHLYSLASESGWQVMLSTHHPAFVDPLKDHTTIVRLHRSSTGMAPNVYRSDSATFTEPEKETLKALLAFDQSVAEMFFCERVIIVEGDTEFAAMNVVMESNIVDFPLDKRPLILRARGKWTIPLLIRMLSHFKVSCAVLHDIDSPKSSGGKKTNGAYTANSKIAECAKHSRDAGIPVIHRCSVPDFERHHGMDLPAKDKPFKAWKTVSEDPGILASVRRVLDELSEPPSNDSANDPDDGRHFETLCKDWANEHAAGNAAFAFD